MSIRPEYNQTCDERKPPVLITSLKQHNNTRAGSFLRVSLVGSGRQFVTFDHYLNHVGWNNWVALVLSVKRQALRGAPLAGWKEDYVDFDPSEVPDAFELVQVITTRK